MFDLLAQALLSGLLIGSVYALIGLGVALTFGAMRIINLSHGEMVLLAAYMAALVEGRLGLDPYAAVPLAIIACSAVAVVVFLLVHRIHGHRELHSLILTFAVGIILTNGILLIWSSDARSTSSAALVDTVQVGDLYAMRSELIAFGLSAGLMVALWWWLKKSWYGRALRAASSDRTAAALMGINPLRIEVAAFVVAAILASFAGIALYTIGVVSPPLGHNLTVKAFIIVVLAGVGSIPGLFLAAILLSTTEALTITFFSSALQEFAAMFLFLLVLYVLPNGMFGAQARRG